MSKKIIDAPIVLDEAAALELIRILEKDEGVKIKGLTNDELKEMDKNSKDMAEVLMKRKG